MLVKATDEFEKCSLFPVELGYIPKAGYIFEVSEDRYKVLSGGNKVGKIFVTKHVPKSLILLPKKKPKQEYKFGVVIPNRNYGEWIEKCLNSILNQTYTNYEIIFVDDCSTDDSVKIAKSLLKKPHKVIELKQIRYTGGARNEGYLNLSKDVDYVFCLDSDDWLNDNKAFEEVNKALKNAPDVLFVGLAEYINGKETFFRVPHYKDRYDALRGWSGNGKFVRKELAMSQECLYHEGTLKEDKNQHCKICIYMRDFVCLEKPYYVWNRDNKNSVTTVRDKVKWKTSTIRHWADTEELYATVGGQDRLIDDYLTERLEQIKLEIKNGGDRQF